jgi:hypothetical protein
MLFGAPRDSDRFERGAALFLRSLVWLVSGYIVSHKIFPIDLAKMHLLEMTGGEFSFSISGLRLHWSPFGILQSKHLPNRHSQKETGYFASAGRPWVLGSS